MMVAMTEYPDGTRLLILGLTAQNVQRLQAGQAVQVTREKHGPAVPKGWAVVVT